MLITNRRNNKDDFAIGAEDDGAVRFDCENSQPSTKRLFGCCLRDHRVRFGSYFETINRSSGSLTDCIGNSVSAGNKRFWTGEIIGQLAGGKCHTYLARRRIASTSGIRLNFKHEVADDIGNFGWIVVSLHEEIKLGGSQETGYAIDHRRAQASPGGVDAVN